MSKTCIDRSDSLIFQHKRRPLVIGFTYAFSGVHFRSNESQTFHRSIMTADDSIKCRCANSGMTGQVGGFQHPGVCLQAFPSFLPHLSWLFYLRHDSCSSFFVPKPHRNTYYAGYIFRWNTSFSRL